MEIIDNIEKSENTQEKLIKTQKKLENSKKTIKNAKLRTIGRLGKSIDLKMRWLDYLLR